MLKKFAEPLQPYAPTILRIMVGITYFLHGQPKTQNIPGFSGYVRSLGVPLPGFFGVVVTLLETVGGLLLMVGLGTRWIGLLFVVEMICTTLLVKAKIGFIAPPGAPTAGAELDLLLLSGALALAVLGSGALSVEQNILKREL